jgi:ParB-like chromosome segregation protein Spo0J
MTRARTARAYAQGPLVKITLQAPDAITPYDRNPRINDNAVDAVARSIEEFGFRQPVVVDEDNVIIVGHTRWKAATKLGLERIPVHVAEGLTPEKAKAYRIADNAAKVSAANAMLKFGRESIELDDLVARVESLEATPGESDA